MDHRRKDIRARPKTTLFMLVSVDGKISTGDRDALDFDKDIPRIIGAKEGLSQYYDLEKKTDFFSLNSGRVFEKICINKPKRHILKLPVNFVVIDDKPHLTELGVRNLLAKARKLYIVTTNRQHPAFRIMSENLEIIYFSKAIHFKQLFQLLRSKIGILRMTIQSGGTLNAVLLREGLLDHLSLVIAPLLVGGRNTSSLIDGESLHTLGDLKKIKVLKFKKAVVLKHDYLQLIYDIVNR